MRGFYCFFCGASFALALAHVASATIDASAPEMAKACGLFLVSMLARTLAKV